MNVLFIAPVFYDYHDLIKRKISEICNADVVFFSEKIDGLIFGILNNLSPLLTRYYQNIYYWLLWRKIRNKKFTHFFLIRGFKIPKFFLRKLRSNNKDAVFIMYQWDSNFNNPYFDKIDFFDKCLTFDLLDYKSHDKLDLLQLFYTEDIRDISENISIIKLEFFCFSSFTIERYKQMLEFIQYCKKNGYSFKAFCYIPLTTYIRLKYLNGMNLDKELLSFKPLSRNEYLNYLQQSSVIVDFNHKTQTGLSMRVIEAFGAYKKVITSNMSIKENPLYSDSWVCIIEDKIDDLKLNFSDELNRVNRNSLYIDEWIKRIFKK